MVPLIHHLVNLCLTLLYVLDFVVRILIQCAEMIHFLLFDLEVHLCPIQFVHHNFQLHLFFFHLILYLVGFALLLDQCHSNLITRFHLFSKLVLLLCLLKAQVFLRHLHLGLQLCLAAALALRLLQVRDYRCIFQAYCLRPL